MRSAIARAWHLALPPWTPSQMFNGSVAGVWLRAQRFGNYQTTDESSPITASGQSVGRAVDLSGNGNHATQPTAGKLMTYVEANGLSYFEPDLAAHAIANAAMSLAQPFYMWLSWRQLPNTGVGARYIFGTNSGGTFEVTKKTTVGVMQHRASAGGAVDGVTVANAAQAVTTHCFNGASGFMQLDNGSPVTTNAGTNGLTGFVWGNRAAQDLGLLDGHLYEIIVAKRGSEDLNALFGARIRSYLALGQKRTL